MELLLNLTWLLLSFACAFAVVKHARRGSESPRLWVVLTAVLCFIVLLFPVISMTDDLHAELYTSEDPGKRRVIADQLQHHAVIVVALATLLPTLLIVTVRSSWNFIDVVVTPLDGSIPSVTSRPPPALLIA